MSQLPTTATLSAGSASTVTVDGAHSHLHVLPLSSGMVVYARGDGATAVVKADRNYACTELWEPTCVPCKSTGIAGSTSISLISASAGDVHVSHCSEPHD